jgi:hypothetical protein
LKDHAEPITADTLRVDDVYFAVQFLDEDMLIPVMEPFIYLGKNLRKVGEKDRFYFQSCESYGAGIRYDSATEDEFEHFQVVLSDEMNHLFEYERALEVLISCSLKRRESRARRPHTT